MSSPGEIARECVEAYLYAAPPLEVLLFRRPPGRGSIWVPISGKVEPSDASFETAVLREVEEETGLRSSRSPEPLDWHVTFPVESGATWRLHAYALRTERSFTPRLSAAHDGADWLRPAEARGRLHYEDNRAALDLLVRRFDPGAANP